jgi:hypothetical protein
MPGVPKEDLEAVRRLPFVTAATLEELMLTVELDDGASITILLAEEYPRGEPAMLGDDCHHLTPGRCVELVQQARGLTRQQSSGYDEDCMVEYRSSQNESEDASQEDAERFTQKYGRSAIEQRLLGKCEWITIKLPLASAVDTHTAKAWGIEPGSTVDVTLKFETRDFVGQSRQPSVEVSQRSKQFQLGQQIRAMLTLYLARCWATSRFVPSSVATHETSRVTVPVPKLDDKQRKLKVTLVEMGFETDRATFAAHECRNVEEALDFDFESFMLQQRAKIASQLQSDEVYDPDRDVNKLVAWRPEGGFLRHIADYVFHRLLTSAQYCVICDKPHMFGANMLRASVCSRDVCVFAFQEFNVGNDAADTIATDGGVIDLLLRIFKAATMSSRADKILSPYPHVMDPMNPKLAFFDPKTKNLDELRGVIRHFPTVTEVLGANSLAQLKSRAMAKDPRVFPLLEWVINSNRALIVKMPETLHLKQMVTKHQFLLITAPPDKQKRFVELKRKHGTKFAFHGSGIENWHAILRSGLRNLSNTDLMTSGAACGPGIYFGPTCSTSLGYCRQGTEPDTDTDAKRRIPGLINDKGMICLALCEIVQDAIHDHVSCWTVSDESRVMTRFFFVFETMADGQAAGGVTPGSDPDFLADLTRVLKHYNVA